MYDLNKRSYFTTLGELRMLLADLPDDTKVCTGGVLGSYLHFAENDSLVSFDDEDLGEDYAEDCPIDDNDFWEGQKALMMKEHEMRLEELSRAGIKKEKTMFNSNFDEMESVILDAYDETILYGEEEDDPDSCYIRTVIQAYVQELIIHDIVEAGFDEMLLDLVGNIDVLIPQEILDFYKNRGK